MMAREGFDDPHRMILWVTTVQERGVGDEPEKKDRSVGCLFRSTTRK